MKLHRGHSFEERFWTRIEKTSNCWLWRGHGDAHGYGFIRMNGRQWRVHQVSWMLHFGTIPNGSQVLHKCDVPACVNPEHLFLGSHADNMNDKARKGRAGWKLSRADVLEIRRRLSCGEKQNAIAKDYGVHQTAIHYISNGDIWRFTCV